MKDSSALPHVSALLEQAANIKIGSGSAAAWGKIGQNSFSEVYVGKTGHLPFSDPITPATRFDLASLTKVLAMTSFYMVLFEKGMIELDAPLEKYLPQEVTENPDLRTITIAQLLSHTSGLPAHRPFFEEMKLRFGVNLPFVSIAPRREFFYSLVLASRREAEPGTRVVYSDIGALILSYLAEKMFPGKTFAHLVQERVWNLIPGCSLQFRPVITDALGERRKIEFSGESVAMTEYCPWRGLLQGQVHDDNCWSMGGLAAHAGVFGSLHDVTAWISGLTNGAFVSPSTFARFSKEVMSPVAARRTLGFDMPALDGSGSTGNSLSMNSIGHLGFTGTSLWLDLNQGAFVVLLTNRVHPTRNDLRIRLLRRAFHALIA